MANAQKPPPAPQKPMTATHKWPRPENLELEFGTIEVDRQFCPSARWEARTLAYMSTPFPLEFFFRPGAFAQGVLCNKNVRRSLSKIFGEIHRIPADERIAKGLSVIYGCYLPLHMIGGILSPHAWGAAISLGRGAEAVKILAPLFEAEEWQSFGKEKRGIFMAVS